MARKKKSTSKRGSRKRKSTKGRRAAEASGTPDINAAPEPDGPGDEERPSGTVTVDEREGEALDELVEDLDAGLDHDVDSALAAARLIAETLAIAGAVGDQAEDEAAPLEPILLDADVDEAVTVELVGGAAAVDGDGEGEGPVARTGDDSPEPETLDRGGDVGAVSSPELRARLLAEAVADAEHREARYRVPLEESRAASWKSLSAVLLFLLAGAVFLVPPGWARPAPLPGLEPEIRLRGLRSALMLQAEQIEVFRLREQRLPTSLEEVPSVVAGVRYVRSGSRAYQLVAHEPDGTAVVYDSAHPTPAFESAVPQWRPEARTP